MPLNHRNDEPATVSGDITEISEHCLRLNIIRPIGTKTGDKHWCIFTAVSGFTSASKDDHVSQPGGMILQSIANGHPIHASIKYRLGIFGFAQSTPLLSEGSSNAGLRDQRLALEWIRDHISSFGGDPSSITIHGQSSGGLAVGMQILAYGASPSPAVPARHRRIPSPRTRHHRKLHAGCHGSRPKRHGVQCRRTGLLCRGRMSYESDHGRPARDADVAHDTTPGANIGDEWLLVIDGDFVPDASSALIAARHGTKLQSLGYSVYIYDQNQTILAAILDESGFPGYQIRSVHTSELAYVFVYGLTPVITAADERLFACGEQVVERVVATEDPSVGRSTLRGWREAVFDDENYGTYVIGGPSAGYVLTRFSPNQDRIVAISNSNSAY
ncbi:Alpha/Beta hydrolase protein [Mycena epipterygia]|nr:Alpha/Beta hydrolase protein [Mycena epipterygia]